MKKWMEKQVNSAWVFGVIFFLSPILLFFLWLILESEFSSWPSSPEINQLHIIRFGVFLILYVGAAFVVSKKLFSGISRKRMLIWGFRTLGLSLIIMVGTVWVDNPVHTAFYSEGVYSAWGWGYPWLICLNSTEFCGFSKGKVREVGVIGNLVFYANGIIIIVAVQKWLRGRLNQSVSK